MLDIFDVFTGRCSPLVYSRRIKEFSGMTTTPKEFGFKVGKFIDLDHSGVMVDMQKRTLSDKLQKDVAKKVGVSYKYEVSWCREGITFNTHAEEIKELAAIIKRDLKDKIKTAKAAMPVLDGCLTEITRHIEFCEHKAKAFHSRDVLLQQMKHYGKQVEQKHPLVVHGITGCGKTSLLAKAAMMCREDETASGKDPVIVVRFCGTTPHSSSARLLMKSICEQILRAYNDETDLLQELQDANFSKIRDTFKMLCGNSRLPSQRRPLVVFIDSLDQLSDENNARRILNWVPSRLAAHTFLVLSTLPKTGGCLSALKERSGDRSIPAKNFIEAGSLTDTDIFDIYKNWFVSKERMLTLEQQKYVLQLAKDDSLEPPTALRLKLLLDISEEWTSYDSLPKLEPSVRGLINFIFNQLEDFYSTPLVSMFSGLLAISKVGLPETDILDMLTLNEEVLNAVLQYDNPPIRRLPYHVLSNLMFQLDEYLIDRGGHGTTLKCWYHRQFWEAAEDRFLSKGQEPYIEKYSKIMVDYYSNSAQKTFPQLLLTPQPFVTLDSNNCPNFNLVALSQLPNVLLTSSAYKSRLTELWCNMKFIALKIAAGLGDELFLDLIKCLQIDHGCSKTIHAYIQFLSVNLHLLHERPELILQLAVNMPLKIRDHMDIGSGLHKVDVSDFLPWVDSSANLLATTTSKSQRSYPCLLTFNLESPVINTEMLSGVGDSPIIVTATQDKCIFVLTSGRKPLMLPIDGSKLILIEASYKHFYIVTLSENDSKCQLSVFKVCLVKNHAMTCEYISSHFVGEPSESSVEGMVSTYVSPCRNYSFALSPDRSMIVTSYVFSEDYFPPKTLAQNKMKLFDISQCFEDERDSCHDIRLVSESQNNDPVSTIAFSRDGKFIVAGLFQERTMSDCSKHGMNGPKSQIKSPNIKFYSLDFKSIHQSGVFLTNKLDQNCRKHFSTPVLGIISQRVNDHTLNIVACMKNSMYTFDVEHKNDGLLSCKSDILSMKLDGTTCFSIATYNRFLCIGNESGTINIYKCHTDSLPEMNGDSSNDPKIVPELFEKVTALHLGPEEVIYSVDCIEDCSLLCTGVQNFVKLWEITPPYKQEATRYDIKCCYYCQFKQILATCGFGEKIQFWNAHTAKLISEFVLDIAENKIIEIASPTMTKDGGLLGAKVSMESFQMPQKCLREFASNVCICKLSYKRSGVIALAKLSILGPTVMQGKSLQFSDDSNLLLDGFPCRPDVIETSSKVRKISHVRKSAKRQISQKSDGPTSYNLTSIFQSNKGSNGENPGLDISSETKNSLHGQWSCDGELFAPMAWVAGDLGRLAFSVYTRAGDKLFPLGPSQAGENFVDCHFLSTNEAIVLLSRDKKYELKSQVCGNTLQMLSIPDMKVLEKIKIKRRSTMTGFGNSQMGDFIITGCGKTVTVYQADPAIPELTPISTFIAEIGVTCFAGFVFDRIVHLLLADSMGQVHSIKIGQGFHMSTKKDKSRKHVSEQEEAIRALITSGIDLQHI